MSKRLIHISDLHLGYSVWTNSANDDVERIRLDSDMLKVECLNELCEDIKLKSQGYYSVVLVTGDVFEVQSGKGSGNAVEKGLHMLEALFAICRYKKTHVLLITGEHDFDKEKPFMNQVSQFNDDEFVHFLTTAGCGDFNGMKIGWIPGKPNQDYAIPDWSSWPKKLDVCNK